MIFELRMPSRTLLYVTIGLVYSFIMTINVYSASDGLEEVWISGMK